MKTGFGCPGNLIFVHLYPCPRFFLNQDTARIVPPLSMDECETRSSNSARRERLNVRCTSQASSDHSRTEHSDSQEQ